MARPAVMLLQAIRLVPFERSVPRGLQVSGELIWSRNGQLELSFGVLAAAASGLSDLILPPGLIDGLQGAGQRRDELWTTTCFEPFSPFRINRLLGDQPGPQRRLAFTGLRATARASASSPSTPHPP